MSMPKDAKENKKELSEEIKEKLKNLKDNIIRKKHKITLDGRNIDYISYSGKIVVNYERDADVPIPKAEVFFVAYVIEAPANTRPISFTFNGGPGSSSVWLHIGMLGPQKITIEKDNKLVKPPFKLSANLTSILDKTDLIFIDPVGTGYSREAPGTPAKSFHSFKTDIKLVGEFIRLYTTRFKRWVSPKYLIGESYGTTRAVGLAGYLLDEFGMRLSGVILISSIINFQTARFNTNNDLPYLLFFPTYAASAWFHKKLDPKLSLKEVVDRSIQFVKKGYLKALFKGGSLNADEYEKIQTEIQELTGLSKEYIDYSKLRINIGKFVKELLRAEKKTIGRLDSRFTGFDRDETGASFEYDPSYAAIYAPFTEAYMDYLSNVLGYKDDLRYHILAPLYLKWKYEDSMNSYLDGGEILRKTMIKSPHMKIFIASGYYDLATPFYATEYTINHLKLPKKLKSNISHNLYEGGHMMYTNPEMLEKINNDIKEFYNQ